MIAAPACTGGVVWVTGLAGCGKTTVAAAVRDRLAASDAIRAVLLDGDRMRALLPATFGYEAQERRKLAMFYARMARELAAQGQWVICSTVSLFHEVHAWNRHHNPRYLEVWLRVPVAELRARGCRAELYVGDGRAGAGGPVVGVEATAEFPVAADVVIDNYGDVSADDAADGIVRALARWPR